jgi:preprotein translocase subunit SecY
MKKKFGDNDILLKRILLSLGILMFIRLGTFLPIPGIDQGYLAFYIQKHSLTRSLANTFSGDNTFVVGLFTLNIFPYINASILMQLLLNVVPELSVLQKEGSTESKRKINRITRIITLVWAIIQSVSIAFYLRRALFDWNLFLAVEIIIWLTTGAMIVLWLSELITEYGLGNGASLLIYTNIVSSLPNLIKRLLLENDQSVGFVSWLIIGLLFFITIYGIVLLQEAARIIPLISSKQLGQASTTFSIFSGDNYNYIPLRFNQAGVMPIILTTSILVVPNYLSNLNLLPKIGLPIDFQYSQVLYWSIHFILIVIFSSFYAWIVLNPKDISDEFQKMSIAIPGIRPGIQTTFYLQQVMTRITTIGAIILATLVTLPNFLASQLNINSLSGLSASSLLIVTGVLLDLRREVKNLYYATIYNEIY